MKTEAAEQLLNIYIESSH